MAGKKEPPYRLDFFQEIVNVSWPSGVFILLQFRAIGLGRIGGPLFPTFYDGPPINADDPLKSAEAVLRVTVAEGAQILYQRNEIIEEQIGTHITTDSTDWTVYYRPYSTTDFYHEDTDFHYFPITFIFNGQSFPDTIAKFNPDTQSEDIFEFRPYADLSPADEADYDFYFFGAGSIHFPWFKRKFTAGEAGDEIPIMQPTFEAVYFIKPPSFPADPVMTEPMFTIVTPNKFLMDTEFLLYIAKGMVLDTSNKSKGIFFDPPTGRVYFPFKWNKNVNPQPYAVEFNYCWDEDLAYAGHGDTYPFVLTKDKHLINPPDPDDPDKSVKDVIFQLYPKRLGTDDTWDVFNYSDTLSYTATFFSGSSPPTWLGLTVTTKPPPKVKDVV